MKYILSAIFFLPLLSSAQTSNIEYIPNNGRSAYPNQAYYLPGTPEAVFYCCC
jgi:hypothetical protein